MKSTPNSAPLQPPPIIRTVLCQASEARAAGAISQATFEAEVERLIKEELCPRCLILLERQLADGRVRFLVKRQDDGAVCDLIEWPAASSLPAGAKGEHEDDVVRAGELRQALAS